MRETCIIFAFPSPITILRYFETEATAMIVINLFSDIQVETRVKVFFYVLWTFARLPRCYELRDFLKHCEKHG